jgi:hypothetical protein
LPEVTDDHDVFGQLLSLLTELVQDDSRFSILDFRLSRPPFALQAVLLKLASYMLAEHGHDLERLMGIGLAMLPAFHTFPGTMQERLFVFFSQEILNRICMLIDQERAAPVLEENTTKGQSPDLVSGSLLTCFFDSLSRI